MNKRNAGKFAAVGKVLVLLTDEERNAVVEHLVLVQSLRQCGPLASTERLIDKFQKAKMI